MKLQKKKKTKLIEKIKEKKYKKQSIIQLNSALGEGIR
jgi:hypothetical protein